MRSCLPLQPTLNHSSPLVYPDRPESPFCAESGRDRGSGRTGAEPGDAGAAAAARAGRGGAARCGPAPRRDAGAGAAQPVHSALVAARRLPAGDALGLARAPRGRADRRHARDDSPRHGDDCLVLRPLTQPVLDGELWRHRELSPQLRGLDLDPVLEARPARARGAANGNRARERSLAARFPELDAAALAYACQMRLALVQVPPRGLWGEERPGAVDDSGGVARAAARRRIPRSTRSCCATSPRSGRRRSADVTTWCRLTGLRGVVERLRPQLVTFRDERGRELFDLPDAPRPDPDTPAPVRFLPEYDNVLLSHDDRSRFVAAADRALLGPVWSTGWGAVLHDGARPCDLAGRARRRGRAPRAAAQARPRIDRRRGTKTRALPRGRSGRAARGGQPLRPAPRRVSASAPRSEANASASGISIPFASAYVSPAAKQSPAP